MELSEQEISALEKEFGRHKRIPPRYKVPILVALSHYPELRNARIWFRPEKRLSTPYGTRTTFSSFIKAPYRRTYIVSILEEAKPPTLHALVKNLPFEAKVAVIGHELAHVVQFYSCSRLELLNLVMKYPFASAQRKIERAADRSTIEHGLGKELYTHATYIRSIPGYVKKRKKIDVNYLTPPEILQYLDGLTNKKTGRIL